ncbi:hypothetical protein [Salarchaeum sp. JOR-1]|uniref:hypothetical protein n=1 Tax=Salarchaeum sp. JOR-1 TaxID=2599399 RepID=UPI001198390A|nr:hypothetical protein [Salarchaeum sp. JOR-1]QDX39609.1 hypothetical protein FQU85_01395 [Salarchaeum sp. JOR-1]
MEVASDDDAIVTVCSALGNEKRLRLLNALRETAGGTLRDVHAETSDVTGLSHRESTHTYLEELVDAALVEKTRNDSGGVVYETDVSELTLSFAD